MKAKDIKVDHIYAPGDPLRCVVAITSDGRVEYDTVDIPMGSIYPSVTMEEFLKWAGWDVTVKGDTRE